MWRGTKAETGIEVCLAGGRSTPFGHSRTGGVARDDGWAGTRGPATRRDARLLSAGGTCMSWSTGPSHGNWRALISLFILGLARQGARGATASLAKGRRRWLRGKCARIGLGLFVGGMAESREAHEPPYPVLVLPQVMRASKGQIGRAHV